MPATKSTAIKSNIKYLVTFETPRTWTQSNRQSFIYLFMPRRDTTTTLWSMIMQIKKGTSTHDRHEKKTTTKRNKTKLKSALDDWQMTTAVRKFKSKHSVAMSTVSVPKFCCLVNELEMTFWYILKKS